MIFRTHDLLNPVITVDKQIAEMVLLHNDMTKNRPKSARWRCSSLWNQAGEGQDYPHQFSGMSSGWLSPSPCLQPVLLIADEPTTALDVTIQARY